MRRRVDALARRSPGPSLCVPPPPLVVTRRFLPPLCLVRSEWAVNQHRDSLALYVGFDSLSHYISIAENESVGRTKFNCLQKMIQPCGPPPPKEEE